MSVATAAFTGWADVHRFSDRSGGHALLAESCSTLRALNPDYPRMYAVAASARRMSMLDCLYLPTLGHRM